MKQHKLEYIEKLNIINVKPEFVVIWLHGLGADYNDFVPIVSQLKINKCLKFIFPNAPYRKITVNNDMEMRAWYDIRDLNKLGDTVDREGILTSVHQIEDLIESLIKDGWASDKIFVCGFSQGGVIAYTTALMTKYKLAGIMALSSYCPDIEALVKVTVINKSTPILACHGKQDTVVPYNAGLMAYSALRGAGYNITWTHYAMEHGVCTEEIQDMSYWLKDRFVDNIT